MSRPGTPLPRPQFPAPGPKVPRAEQKTKIGFFFFLSLPFLELESPLEILVRAHRDAEAQGANRSTCASAEGASWDSNPGLQLGFQTILSLTAERALGTIFSSQSILGTGRMRTGSPFLRPVQ